MFAVAVVVVVVVVVAAAAAAAAVAVEMGSMSPAAAESSTVLRVQTPEAHLLVVVVAVAETHLSGTFRLFSPGPTAQRRWRPTSWPAPLRTASGDADL